MSCQASFRNALNSAFANDSCRCRSTHGIGYIAQLSAHVNRWQLKALTASVRNCGHWLACLVVIDVHLMTGLAFGQTTQFQEKTVTPSLKEIEERAAAGRAKVRSGHVAIKTKATTEGSPADSITFYTECYFDGASLRCDHHGEVAVEPPHPTARSSTDKTTPHQGSSTQVGRGARILSQHNGKWYSWLKGLSDTRFNTVLTVADIDAVNKVESERWLREEMSRIKDPRRLGLSVWPSTYLHMIGRAPAWVNMKKNQVEITPDNYEGYHAWKIRFATDVNGAEMTCDVWVVPDWDWAMGRCQTSWKEEGSETQYRYAEHVRAGAWFPSRIVSRSFYKGALRVTEEVSVEVRSLNEPIPADVFTPKGFGVPAGTRVRLLPSVDEWTSRREWNGEQIVPVSRDSMDASSEQLTKGNRGWLRIALGVILAAMGTALVVWGSRAIIGRLARGSR